MFTALDLVSIQTQTRVQGNKVRRNNNLTEVNHYDAENDEINVQDVYQWQAETDQFIKMGDSNTLDAIKFDRGWDQRRLDDEIFKREVILAYLVDNEISDYVRVAATIQAFINDPDTVLTLIANNHLEAALEDLREMESVDIQVDPEKEALVPRPTPDDETATEAGQILDEADERFFQELKGQVPTGLGGALEGMAEQEESITPSADSASSPEELEFGGDVEEDEFDFGVDDAGSIEDLATGEEAVEEQEPVTGAGDGPSWLEDDGGDGFAFDDDESDGSIWGGDEDAEAEPDAEEPAPEEPETEPTGAADGAEAADGADTKIFGGDEDDDAGSMDSIFGDGDDDEDVSLFEDDDDSIFEGDDDDDSIFGDVEGAQADDDEVDSIFGDDEEDE
jgi:flagellar protein FlaI